MFVDQLEEVRTNLEMTFSDGFLHVDALMLVEQHNLHLPALCGQ